MKTQIKKECSQNEKEHEIFKESFIQLKTDMRWLKKILSVILTLNVGIIIALIKGGI